MVAPAVTAESEARPWTQELAGPWTLQRLAPVIAGAIAFVFLFADPVRGLVSAWWNDPDAGHGLLLFPVSLWLAWKSGIRPDARANVRLGTATIFGAVVIRALGGLAAEFFTQRFSIWLTLVGVVIFIWGFRQVLRWWLPFTLLLLAIPLPATIINSLAVPLAAICEWLSVAVSACPP